MEKRKRNQGKERMSKQLHDMDLDWISQNPYSFHVYLTPAPAEQLPCAHATEELSLAFLSPYLLPLLLLFPQHPLFLWEQGK
jgi:hypothetical protein